jgi:hypothetical protein
VVRAVWVSAASLALAACGKVAGDEVDAAPPDGVLADAEVAVDAAVDAAPAVPDGLDCKQIHDNTPERPSGRYLIDPDGDGGEPALEVTCDMVTAGGGWTLVFLGELDYRADVPYTSATTALLARSSTALIAYRRETGLVRDNFATFPLPQAWKDHPPFYYLAEDLTLEVKVDGETAATQRTLRFGRQNFSSLCGDAWTTAGEGTPEFAPYGRLCIVGTRAPFYSGFADPRPATTVDHCSSSDAAYSAVACAADRRFSIAVR